MRTINRYNYEEFFLLYIDNELDEQQKEAVERFVQQNADLGAELNMLMETKCAPEEISFNNKENLIRTEGDNINETNFEEYFLLYLDNELSAAKKHEVETYILQHPQLQNAFTSLKEAVLEPELIVFENKAELYRSEKRRTIPIRTWRLAVAAAFIGLCGLGWWLLQTTPSQITATNSVKPATESTTGTQPGEPVSKGGDTKQPDVPSEIAPAKNESGDQAANVAGKNSNPKRKDEYAANSHTISKNSVHTTKGSTKDENNNIAQTTQPENRQHDVTINSNQMHQEETLEAPVEQPADNTTHDNTNYTIYPVAYKEINTNDEDRSVYVGVLNLNKDKVKGFLKKAGRLFNNKSTDLANEDGKLQVANFEIETNKQ